MINQNNDIDPLLRSVEVNNLYLKTNKVVGIDKTQQNQAFNKKKTEEIKVQDEETNEEALDT